MDHEVARIRSLGETLPGLGYEPMMTDMFFESTMELLGKVRQAVEQGDQSEFVLTNTLNEQSESDSILFFFKVCSTVFLGDLPASP